jgi:peptidoglycan/LPS O-acetylase OafA/YrhL
MQKKNTLVHLKYRPDIDGLRALAVLAVVAFHAFPSWVRGGFIGVDIFFVISGYLISTIIFENLDKGTFNFTEFYTRRIKRIFPALLLVLIACFVFGWFALLANEYKQLGKHIAAGASFISNFILWSEAGYFDNSAETKPLLHLWSLGIEEQFYIIWPLLLWLTWKYKFNLLTMTIAITIASFVLNIKGVEQDMVATFYSPQTRLWELLSGTLLAWFTLYKKETLFNTKHRVDFWLSRIIYSERQESDGLILANTLSFIGLLLLLYGFWRINKDLSFPGQWALIPTLGALLIIAAGSKAWVNQRVLSNKVAVWFGLISFPLYLWHWPILSFARIVEGEVPSRNTRIAAVALSVALAWITYKLLECPIRFGKFSKVKVTVLVMLMAGIGYVGYVTYKGDGFGFRFPKIVQELGVYKYDDYHLDYREGTCFLRPEQTYKDFKNCYSKNLDGKSTIFLWGDSHAAHLYPGIKKRYELNSNVAQYTASGCAPIIDYDAPNRIHCRGVNNFIIDAIRKEQPDTVILSAMWTAYDLSNLDNTITLLKKANIRNIAVIGPVTQWNDNLPKQLVKHFNNSFPHVVPERMRTGLNQNFIQLDEALKVRFKSNGVKYISTKELLCDSAGCITMTGKGVDTLMVWDYGHLTKTGSEFLVDKFPNF